MNANLAKVGLLIDRYWDLAYNEGCEGRTEDTEAGNAAKTRCEIDAELAALAARVEVAERVIRYARNYVRCARSNSNISPYIKENSIGGGASPWAELMNGLAEYDSALADAWRVG